MLITCQVIRSPVRYTTEHDLPLVVNSSALIYADDSTIHTSTEIIEEKLNRDNKNNEKWCNQNNLVLN